MNLIEKLKGVFRKMIGAKDIARVLNLTPTISTTMKTNMELWEDMYMNKAPWIAESNGKIKSLNLAAMIAEEKARTATIELEVKITGDNERAKFVKDNYGKLECRLREELECGIALGGFVIKPYVVMGPKNKYVIEFNFTKATDFYPLSFAPDGKVIEAAFVDRIVTKDKVFSKVEYHKLEGTLLTIRNMAFENTLNGNQATPLNPNQLGTAIPLTSVTMWANIAPEVQIKDMDSLLFAYFKMPVANTIDLDSPLGVSGFSRAVDLIKHADELYSDLLWEFEGSQLAVDVDRTALNWLKDTDGKVKEVLPQLQDRLFRRNLDLGTDDTYNVFSPSIRDASIINGLNNQLMRIEDACAISRGTLSVVSTSEARTATELKILKQRSYSANQDIQKSLQETLEAVFHIIDKYCDMYDIVGSGEFEVAYKWDDSIIVDKDAERQQDLLEVNSGLMSKLEYRMKWFGETEEQATASLKQVDSEKEASMQLQMKYKMQQQTNNGGAKSEAQASNDKLKRANESNETTKVSKNKSDN